MGDNEKMSFEDIKKVIQRIESRVYTLRLSKGAPINGPSGVARRSLVYFSSADIKLLRTQELTKEQEKTIMKLEKKIHKYF